MGVAYAPLRRSYRLALRRLLYSRSLPRNAPGGGLRLSLGRSSCAVCSLLSALAGGLQRIPSLSYSLLLCSRALSALTLKHVSSCVAPFYGVRPLWRPCGSLSRPLRRPGTPRLWRGCPLFCDVFFGASGSNALSLSPAPLLVFPFPLLFFSLRSVPRGEFLSPLHPPK